MLGLEVTINAEPTLLVAAPDMTEILAMVTATGGLGPATRTVVDGEPLRCWLSVRCREQSQDGPPTRSQRVLRYGLQIGHRLAMRIVETVGPGAPPRLTGDAHSTPATPPKMFAFAIARNGEAPIVAGGEALYSLTTVLRLAPHTSDRSRLLVSGLHCPKGTETEEHVHWLNHEDLRIGDLVTLDVIDTEHATPARPPDSSSDDS